MADGAGRPFQLAVVWLALVVGCAAELAPGGDEEDAEYETVVQRLEVVERRHMLFEGSCEFLACCSKRNCSLPDADVIGACGTGCSDSVPWIARPNRDRRYSCGECVRVCLADTTTCVDAVVWDNSITRSAIEGNIALFDALGLSHSDDPRACTGTGGAWVDVGPCTDDPPADDPPPADGGAPDPGGEFAGVYCTDPGGWCGGHEPCWPHYDCPSGSSCDWSSGSFGRCVY